MTNMAAMASEEVRKSQEVLSDLQLIQHHAELLFLSDCWQGRLTASAVGQIVGLQSEEIKQMASEYAEKVSRRRGLRRARIHHRCHAAAAAGAVT